MPSGVFFEKQKLLIDKQLSKAIPRKISKKWLEFVLGKPQYSYDLNALTKSISIPLWDFIGRGGKRWRPVLMLLSCEAVNGGNSKKFSQFAALPELIHSGTILVDDLEDNSKLRRGKPCIHLLYGTDVAINDSSLLYFVALPLLYRNPFKLPRETLLKIYNSYSEEMLRVSIGQATDIQWHKLQNFSISEQQYLQMCVNKTGVLARFSAKLGAILGKASQKQIDALGKFGESIGVAFQIQDDILNLTSKEFVKGKGFLGEDIHEGKITLIVIKTIERASAKDRKQLVKILKAHPSGEKTILKAIKILKKYGAIDYSREKAKKIISKAWNELEKSLPESKAKHSLKEFAQFLIERNI